MFPSCSVIWQQRGCRLFSAWIQQLGSCAQRWELRPLIAFLPGYLHNSLIIQLWGWKAQAKVMSVPSASPLNKRSHGRCILISVSVFVFLRSRKVTIFARFIVSVKKKAAPEQHGEDSSHLSPQKLHREIILRGLNGPYQWLWLQIFNCQVSNLFYTPDWLDNESTQSSQHLSAGADELLSCRLLTAVKMTFANLPYWVPKQ